MLKAWKEKEYFEGPRVLKKTPAWESMLLMESILFPKNHEKTLRGFPVKGRPVRS